MIEPNIVYLWIIAISTNLFLLLWITGLTRSENKRIVKLTTIPAFISIIGFALLFFTNAIEEGFIFGICACFVACIFIAIGFVVMLLLSVFTEWLWDIFKS